MNIIVNICVIINFHQSKTMSSLNPQLTQDSFDSTKQQFLEALERYKENNPTAIDQYQEFEKLFNIIGLKSSRFKKDCTLFVKSSQDFKIENINKPFAEQYPVYGIYRTFTLLQLAVVLDSPELVRSMLEHGAGLSIEHRDRDGDTALHHATRGENIEIVKIGRAHV